MKTLLALVMLPSIATADPLPKEVEGMSCLLGSWKGSGTLTMGKDTQKLEATWTCKRTGGDFGVLCHLRLLGIPGVPVYEETDLFGYEPNSRTYHWFTVTNGAETHDHSAAATDKDEIRFTYTGTQEGKPFKEIIDWKFSGAAKPGALPTRIGVRAETFAGKVSTSVIELAMKKQ